MTKQDIYNAIQAKLQEAGLAVEALQADGQLHRCGTARTPHGLDAAYVIHPDEPISVWWQNWQTGLTGTWNTKDHKGLSSEERRTMAARIVEDKRRGEEARQRQYAEAEKKAEELWAKAAPIDGQAHAYLEKKGVQSYGLRVLGEALVVPVYSENGQIQSLQFISEDGTKRFLTGGKMSGGFYCIPTKDGINNGPLCLSEGYATGASIFEATGYAVLVTFTAGNILSVAQMTRKHYPEREIIVCADYDDPSEQYPQAGGTGLAKATEAAKAIGAVLAIPDLGGVKCDFNDLAQVRGLEEVAKQIFITLQKTPVSPESCVNPLQSRINGTQVLHTGFSTCVNDGVASELPEGFYFVEEGPQAGLWYEMEQSGQNKDGTSKEPVEIYLGPKLEVIAQSRDAQSEGWSKLCLWHDPKGVEHRRLVSMSAVTRADTGPWLSEVLAVGGWLPCAAKGVAGLLKKYLLEAKPAKFVRQVSRSGWYGEAFVLPTGTVGELEGEEVLFDGGTENTAFAEAGTLEGWQASIGELSKGNSRLIFAVSAAFVSILIGPCGAESGGIVFVGGSSSGKTTCLQASASAWGRGSESGGYLRTWRATSNGLEGAASAFSDCLLSLDELGEVDAREIGTITYMLANGQGKSRAKRNGDARQVKNWRAFILSTGEVTVKQMIESGGKKAKAGQDVRLVCIPADAGAGMGVFEDLHGYADAGSLARALKSAACENYGHAAKAFIKAFQGQREEAVREIKAALSKGLSKVFPSEGTFTEADGQVLRVATRFLLVALAGECAAEWGVVPWQQGDALAAAKRCFVDWLNERGSVGAAEEEAIIHDVTAFLEQNATSRFQNWENPEDKIIGRVGFRKMENFKQIFYVLPESIKVVCAGHDLALAKKTLHKRGMLIKKEKESYSSTEYPPNMGKQRCYLLTLGADNEME